MVELRYVGSRHRARLNFRHDFQALTVETRKAVKKKSRIVQTVRDLLDQHPDARQVLLCGCTFARTFH